jgi:hypothetical protein
MTPEEVDKLRASAQQLIELMRQGSAKPWVHEMFEEGMRDGVTVDKILNAMLRVCKTCRKDVWQHDVSHRPNEWNDHAYLDLICPM